jgi:hypothetical protein
MPIVEPAWPGAPLSQGDLLKDITPYLTADEWKEGSVRPEKSPHHIGLALSWPCAIEHKP